MTEWNSSVTRAMPPHWVLAAPLGAFSVSALELADASTLVGGTRIGIVMPSASSGNKPVAASNRLQLPAKRRISAHGSEMARKSRLAFAARTCHPNRRRGFVRSLPVP